MNALQGMEETGDMQKLVELFSEDAELRRLTLDEAYHGREGARAFWNEYLEQFREIRSTFHNVIEGDNTAALEWTSKGRLREGEEIEYRGVSILEWDGDQVQRFRTYYDSAAFIAQPAEEGEASPGLRRSPSWTEGRA
ncbi:MAG: nuclear transport factor 2 family protein [Chloroflexota bacterium]|nr:nuclear transport factor 2 family protein [Chloroflexota bacterium]